MSREAVLTSLIVTAHERLRESQSGQLAHWMDLFIALGRALQAAAQGDDAETRLWLHEAADIECLLCGDTTRTVNAVIVAMDEASICPQQPRPRDPPAGKP